VEALKLLCQNGAHADVNTANQVSGQPSLIRSSLPNVDALYPILTDCFDVVNLDFDDFPSISLFNIKHKIEIIHWKSLNLMLIIL